MPGLRIHHPTLSECKLVIPHPGDPATGRRPKDYYVELDTEGDCLVSETVWRRLEEARQSGLSPHQFLVLNEVLDPPTIVVRGPGSDPPRSRPIRTLRTMPDGSVHDDELQAVAQELAPKGVRPRITRKDR